MFFKTAVLKNLAMLTGKPCDESLFNKVAFLQACNFVQKKLQQIFSYKYCKIFKNNFFYITPLVAASESVMADFLSNMTRSLLRRVIPKSSENLIKRCFSFCP